MINNIINFCLFQVGWFVCILGAAWNYTYIAIAISIGILFLHLYLTDKKANDIKLSAIAATFGFIFDGIMQFNNMIIYNNPGVPYPFTPIWIVILWILFAITLNHSLAWLKGRTSLAMLFGLMGGPLVYLAGERLMAVTIASPNTFIVLAIGWAFITPLLISFGEKK
tara:strand:- start:24203 stop:24703 length:501 start_codon:yes stop_codon:yes gene_type:complete